MVTLLMTETQAVAEANRCLHCFDAPCIKDCPAGINVPRFIQRMTSGDWVGAAETIKESNPLGFVCGQVCPADMLCQKNCNRADKGGVIQIADLQSYAMHKALEENLLRQPESKKQKVKKIAVVGGGPSGVTASTLLAGLGYQVTVYERSDELGGIPLREIPNDRLIKAAYKKELEQLVSDKVTIKTNTVVDEELAKEIMDNYDAIYLACGLGEPSTHIRSSAENYLMAEDFLTNANAGEYEGGGVSGTVVVQGGGNTAIDAAMTAKALGAERSIISYRRGLKEMPAWPEEYLQAAGLGVEFLFHTQILDVKEKDGKIVGITLASVSLGEPGSDGRRVPIVNEQEIFDISADLLISATGRPANEAMLDVFSDVKESGRFFIGGDANNGGETVVKAVAEAKDAVDAIHAYLSKE